MHRERERERERQERIHFLEIAANSKLANSIQFQMFGQVGKRKASFGPRLLLLASNGPKTPNRLIIWAHYL
ncbi:hypothetical protein BT93_H3696 [Corymbia citriodora subsp. variegata]|nr:hypothetical protein BT93_H3696 [Corymbia citriodora subsp. variegata]